MDLRAAGLKEQPFRARGKPLVFVGYAGQQKAQEFFEQTAQHNAGLGENRLGALAANTLATASPIRATSPRGTTIPATGSRSISGTLPTSVATTGRPAANACATTPDCVADR